MVFYVNNLLCILRIIYTVASYFPCPVAFLVLQQLSWPRFLVSVILIGKHLLAMASLNCIARLCLQIWHSNVPHNKIAERKGHQGWMKEDGPYFIFPGGGTMFPDGAVSYIKKLDQYIPIDKHAIRTALDMGCGVCTLLYTLHTCVIIHLLCIT